MIFTQTQLSGAYIVELEPAADERGFFARSWCAREFEDHGLNGRVVQCNVSYNASKGTLRGMHYQAAPDEEAKLVRVTSGAVYDVIVDLRESSPSRGRWYATELSAENRRMLYIPEGFAHGFQTLADHTEVFYQMSEFYSPHSARGFRWDDPAVGIKWPDGPRVISEKDLGYPELRL